VADVEGVPRARGFNYPHDLEEGLDSLGKFIPKELVAHVVNNQNWMDTTD
jgi:hypothetical protein